MAYGEENHAGTKVKEGLIVGDGMAIGKGQLVRMKGDDKSVFFVVSIADTVMEGELARIRRVHPPPREDVGFVSLEQLKGCNQDDYPIGDALSRLVVQNLHRKIGSNGISMRSGLTQFKAFQFRPLLRYLSNPRKRLLIADDVGLGKTIEAIYIMIEEMAKSPLERVAIICPANLRLKWRRELWRRFGLYFGIIHGKRLLQLLRENERFRCIVSMDAMRRRMNELRAIVPTCSHVDMLLVDEVHNLIGGNNGTLRREFVSSLSLISNRVVGLTATPIQLNLLDLKRVMELIDPMEWSDEIFLQQMELRAALVNAYRILSQKEWSEELTTELQRTIKEAQSLSSSIGDKTISDVLQAIANDIRRSDAATLEMRVGIRRRIGTADPLGGKFTRTRRGGVDEDRDRLPITMRIKLDEPVLTVVQNGEEVSVSEQSLFSEVDELLEKSFSHVHRRQLSSCLPAMIGLLESGLKGFRVWKNADVTISDDEIEDLDDDARRNWEEVSRPLSEEEARKCEELANKYNLLQRDTKFEMMIEELRRLRDNGLARKAIVFTHWRPTIDYLKRKMVGLSDMKCFTVSWKDPPEGIDKTLTSFQEFEGFAILLTSDVLSEGVDIQSADCVVNYDLPYNPQKVAQRIGRVDRIGQKSDRIAIINLLVENSTDEVVYDTLLKRIGIFERYVGDMPATLTRTWSPHNLIDRDEIARKLEYLEDVRRIQESDAIQGMDEVLDEETLDIYRERRHNLAELRAVVLRDMFQMMLGRESASLIGSDAMTLKVSGLTAEDAETFARMAPIEVADEMRRLITHFARRGPEVTLTAKPDGDGFYIALMHPLMQTAIEITHSYHNPNDGSNLVDVINISCSRPDELDDWSTIIITEHSYKSDWNTNVDWIWWGIGQSGKEPTELEGVEVTNLLRLSAEFRYVVVEHAEALEMLSRRDVDTVREVHARRLTEFTERASSQMLTKKESEIERLRIMKWRTEGFIERDDIDDSLKRRLQSELNRLERLKANVEGEVEAAKDYDIESPISESDWRLVAIVRRS